MTDKMFLFKCPDCSRPLEGFRPERCSCGYEISVKDNILQLTDMPDMVLDSDGDNYIGYEHIGKHYSGYDGTYEINEDARTVARQIKGLINDGVILDLGCGDGAYTIPLALEGVNVVAGDISNGMMRLLKSSPCQHRYEPHHSGADERAVSPA